jgi:hypothetical protein
MTFDKQSAAFLHLLQEDLFGLLAELRQAREAEATRLMLSAIRESDRGFYARAVDLAGVPVPTRFESPQGYAILTGLADDILAALAEDVTLPNPPLIGTLPLGWPTALLVRVPDSTAHLAIVDDKFTTFANLLAKACAQGLMPDPNDDSEEAWKAGLVSATHPGVARYVEFVTATLLAGPAAAPGYWPDRASSHISSQLRTAIELFVVAAPFAQLAEGVPEKSPVLPLTSIHLKGETYELTERQRAMTFMLQLGLMATVFDRRGYDKALGYWGIEMFLRTVALMETLQARLHGLEEPSGTLAQEELNRLQCIFAQWAKKHSGFRPALERFEPVTEAFLGQAALAVAGHVGGVH